MIRHITAAFGFVFVLLATSVPAFCQGAPGSYTPPLPSYNPCVTSRPAPSIARSVRVDVPVPCVPFGCAPPPCAPPCRTQPVQVRVDVVVRPEAPKPCPPQLFCCENPPVFEPIFCQAAGLAKSLIAAPLFLGERLLGHCVPMPMPTPCPMPCWRMPPPACPPPVPCGLGRPPVKVVGPTACGPSPTWTGPPSGPSPGRRQYR